MNTRNNSGFDLNFYDDYSQMELDHHQYHGQIECTFRKYRLLLLTERNLKMKTRDIFVGFEDKIRFSIA